MVLNDRMKIMINTVVLVGNLEKKSVLPKPNTNIKCWNYVKRRRKTKFNKIHRYYAKTLLKTDPLIFK